MSIKKKTFFATFIALYFFISSIVIIKSSACDIGETLAEKIILLIKDTSSAVFAGWITTAILHSSGAFDSIIVAFTSSGVIPLGLAVAAIIGAEMGTTVTPFLVSLFDFIRGKGKRGASFNVTMSHVLYNLFTLLLFYPLELFLGIFSKIATAGSSLFIKINWFGSIPDLIGLATPWVDLLVHSIPPWMGILLGCIILVVSLGMMEKYMTEIFSMPRSWNIIRSTFMKPGRAFISGFIFTLLVPSTTVMVSLLVPLASSGVIRAEYYILPYILGANIGTVFDVMVAAFATGDPVSMGVWFVHLTINLLGAVIFFPLLKPFSLITRKASEYVSSSPKITLIFAALFHIIPISIILGYTLF